MASFIFNPDLETSSFILFMVLESAGKANKVDKDLLVSFCHSKRPLNFQVEPFRARFWENKEAISAASTLR